MELREKIVAGFYFKDGNKVRFCEMAIDVEAASIKLQLDGIDAPVDPSRVYVAILNTQ